MIEFIVGVAVGMAASILAMHAAWPSDSHEVRAEHRAYRQALLNIRWGHAGHGANVARYIDRVLGNEAG